MSSTRSFAKGLGKIGTAGDVRKTVSQAVKESSLMSKSSPIEPIEYESYIVKNKSVIHNDPQRDLLLFPYDEIHEETITRELRTEHSSVPPGAESQVTHLLAQECIKTYTSNWSLVHNKYEPYSGSYLKLNRGISKNGTDLPDQLFEADIEDKDEENLSLSKNSTEVAKKGWLIDNVNDGSGFLSRSYKKRHVSLERQKDNTYALVIGKDDKKSEGKWQLYLDSALEVLLSKKGKFGFEIKMQDGGFHYFAAESEQDLGDWIRAIKSVINSDTISQKSMKNDDDAVSLNGNDNQDDKPSGHHQDITRYMRETDMMLTSERKQHRVELFDVYSQLPRNSKEKESEVGMFSERFTHRFTVSLSEFKLKLQANVGEEIGKEILDNPEPFFLTFALYDSNGKLTENAYLDCNSDIVYQMIPEELIKGNEMQHSSSQAKVVSPTLRVNNEKWLSKPGKLLFNVNSLQPDVYIVVLIEKVLQGSMSAAIEPYLKGFDIKTASKVHKSMKQYCQTIGHYKMPFGWAAKQLCRSKGQVDYTAAALSIYKQEANRISEEDLIKHLADLSRPEKSGKLTCIPGTLQIVLDVYDSMAKQEGILTPSLDVVKPFPLSIDRLPIMEVELFSDGKAENAEPFNIYRNHLYVYPMNVKFDNVKGVKARNIAVCIELRDADDENSVPLKCIYSRTRTSPFSVISTCAVIHHVTCPDFYEEIKICLPAEVTERHHLFITFYHVSCESCVKINRSSLKGNVENPIGYSWLPLMRTKSRIVDGDHLLPVASSLPSGYLSFDAQSIAKSGPDIKWHDGTKGLFKLKLKLHSTIYTNDQHIHNFFLHCQKVQNTPTASNETEAKNMLKALLAANMTTVIHFLPTLLNQLFKLLPSITNEEVAFESLRVLVHVVHELASAKRDDLLRSYVKYAFNTTDLCSQKTRTVHEELVKLVTSLLRPNNSDFLTALKFLHHSWFFFDIIIKSVSQTLLSTNRIKMTRPERFSTTKETNFVCRLDTFLRMIISHIFLKHKENAEEIKRANTAVSNFIKRLFTLLDRGSVFKFVNLYMENFGLGDPKVLQEFKFEFIKIICSHEHYVQLCLPTLKSGYSVSKDSKADYSLTDEHRKKHFLSGLLLQELKSALNEIKDVRQIAITTLRNQLAKHAWDDRYQKEDSQKRKPLLGRIITLYLPLFNILIENKNRLTPRDKPAYHTNLSNRNSVVLAEIPETNGVSESSQSKTASLPGYNSSRMSMVSEPSSGNSSSKDSSILAYIAGQAPGTPGLNKKSRTGTVEIVNVKTFLPSENDLSRSGSKTSLASDDSTSTIDAKDSVSLAGFTRGSTVAQNAQRRYDKLESSEVKDLLMCFLFVVKNMPEDVLLQWMTNATEDELIDFFDLFQICLTQFKYVGKKRLTTMSALSASYSSKKSASIPSRTGYPGKNSRLSNTMYEMEDAIRNPDLLKMEGNLIAEVGMIVLDVLSLHTQHFKSQLMYKEGDNPMMMKIFDLHMNFLGIHQSEQTLRHCFGLIRMFIAKFQLTLFRGKAGYCGRLCYELLRCCNSHLQLIRIEACITLYFLIRANYEFNKRTSFARVRLQMMVSVSTLISDIEGGITGTRFQDSLGIINNYANKDRTMNKTKLATEVNMLTKKIRAVLMATHQMKDHQKDPEKLVDLQHSLAEKYISSPELRTTWLQNMAKRHLEWGEFSEAAHCYLHIAGAVAEFLKQMGLLKDGCKLLNSLSVNIEGDETNTIDDRAVIEELQFSEDTLVENLEKAAQYLFQAERYEALGSLYRIVIPIYEKKRDLQSLSDCYKRLHEAYSKAVEVTSSGKRILGSFFRVAFYGQAFEDEHGKEYIYKEPKLTKLPEICERLQHLYGEKLGHNVVKILHESKQVDPKTLDQQYVYIQVTYVEPYFTEKELNDRKTDFERNTNIKKFIFSTPFTKTGKAQGSITEQYARRTILTSTQAFPYVKKRIAVCDRKDFELTPIEVAIDEMNAKVEQLYVEVTAHTPDIKKLQLKLQGAVSTTVNAGPMAYAEAFLSTGAAAKLKLSSQHVDKLKNIFREFATICHQALDLNSRLIDKDQVEYQESLEYNFKLMKDKLQEILSEQEILLTTPQLLTEVMNALDQRNSSLYLSASTTSSSNV